MIVPKLVGAGLVLAVGTVLFLRSTGHERALTVDGASGRSGPSAPQPVSAATLGDDPRREPQTPVPAPSAAPAAAAAELLPPAVERASTGALRLTLTWSDGTPAADQTVRVADSGRLSYESPEGRTDASGTCTLVGLRPGRAWITPERAEFWSTAEILAGEETVLALQLEEGWDVEGTVVDANGDAVAGAAVWLGELGASAERLFLVATSGADGSFFVRDCPDLGSLWARMPGHAPARMRTLVETRTQPAGSTIPLTLALEGPGATVAGVVRDPEGQPVEGALVLVDGQGMLRAEALTLPGGDVTYLAHSMPTSTRTDAAGRFTVAGVRPGQVPVGVIAPGLAAWRTTVEAAAGATAEVTIALAPGFTLSGTVRDAGGTPVWGRVHVLLSCAQLSPSVMTGADGAFELTGLAPGPVRVRVDGPAGEAWTTLTGLAGEVLSWDAYLGPDEPSEPWFETQPWR